MYRLQFGPYGFKSLNKYNVCLLQDTLNRDQRCWEDLIDVGRNYKFVPFHSLQCNDDAS